MNSNEKLSEIYKLIDGLDQKDLTSVKDYIEEKLKNSNNNEFTNDMYQDFIIMVEGIDGSDKVETSKNINKFFKDFKCTEFSEEYADCLISHNCKLSHKSKNIQFTVFISGGHKNPDVFVQITINEKKYNVYDNLEMKQEKLKESAKVLFEYIKTKKSFDVFLNLLELYINMFQETFMGYFF